AAIDSCLAVMRQQGEQKRYMDERIAERKSPMARLPYASTGSRHFGPWFRTLPTYELTGKASIRSLANGTNNECSESVEERWSSQVLSDTESRITGIRSWR